MWRTHEQWSLDGRREITTYSKERRNDPEQAEDKEYIFLWDGVGGERKKMRTSDKLWREEERGRLFLS